MSRLDQRFAQLREQKRAGLITFTMAYDPDLETSFSLLSGLADAGADIIELGVPFSDPMADGPIIQAAGKRALEAGATLKGILEMVRRFRTKNTHTPLILMGYYNPIYRYGAATFAQDAIAAGVDGMIIVDLPPEEEEELVSETTPRGLPLIRLLAPTTPKHRVDKLVKSSQGFVYYISVAGITGAGAADKNALESRIAELKTQTSLPIAAGFGIKTPEQVAALAPFADAIVVGSALVDLFAKAPPVDKIPTALAFVKSLAQATK